MRLERITTRAAVRDGKYSEMISWQDAERYLPVVVLADIVVVCDMLDISSEREDGSGVRC